MGLFSRKKKEDKNPPVGGEKKSFDELSSIVDEKTKKQEIKKSKNQEKGKDKKKGEDELKHDHGLAYQYIIRPVITEKVSFLGMNNSYVFEVSPRVNRIEVKKAIKNLY